MHKRALLFGSLNFDYWNQPLNMVHTCLLPRFSWSWTVLLPPSDTHRKPILSITTVLLPFVTYLLTIPHITPQQRSSCV
jgi:hypothetical protein